jgi:NAD(P)-dependent dehydrogenase (short-subunit alcohol dehydrogenase family)
MDTLVGRTAVVTGAAGGIGLALAERFAAEGMQVVLSDLDRERLENAAEEVANSGAEVLAVPGDVARWDDVERLALVVAERFGPVHVLCNNAGVQLTGATWEFELREWEWMLGVNLWGVIHGIKAFVPRMLEHGEPGHVVNTASVGGLVVFPGMAIYAASKFGVVAISESLAHDLGERGSRIGVSLLCPGPTMSDLRENSTVLRPGGEEGRPIPLVAELDRMPAETVAGMVVDAVRRDRFWVLTHPEYGALVEHRARGVVAGDRVLRGEIL